MAGAADNPGDNRGVPGRDPEARRDPTLPAGAGDPAQGPIPEDLVDRFFDEDLDEGARRAFLRSLPKDLDRCEDVASTRRMLDLLRASGQAAHRHAPDLTGRIVAAVDSRRGFASGHVRSIARVMRLGLAAGLVLLVGAVAAVERVNPNATRLAPAPAPLTSAVDQTQSEMASTIGSIASTIETIQLRVEGAGHAPRHALHGHAHGPTPAVAVAAREMPEVVVVTEGAGPGLLAITTDVLSADAPAKRIGSVAAGGERDGGTPIAGRTVSVGLAYSLKPDPRRAAWTLDMAPACATPRHIARIIDADGRCTGMVMPLGVDRGDMGGGPFLLPGRELGLRAPQGVLTTPRVPLAP